MAVGEQCDVALRAEAPHAIVRPAVDQRILSWVDGEICTGIEKFAELIGVEVGDAEQPDLALALQVAKYDGGVDGFFHAPVPPEELHEIERVDAEAQQ